MKHISLGGVQESCQSGISYEERRALRCVSVLR